MYIFSDGSGTHGDKASLPFGVEWARCVVDTEGISAVHGTIQSVDLVLRLGIRTGIVRDRGIENKVSYSRGVVGCVLICSVSAAER